ncbi:DnaA N-terminal domain-containing protein [Anaerolineales bacterium HSG24]|nr:DnaA N-terminal domain-containing protein [Anaerolineales bacterium HSG24]
MMNSSSFYSNSSDSTDDSLEFEVNRLWKQTLEQLSESMTQATFNSLLTGSVPVQLYNDTLTIAVPSNYAADWLNHRLIEGINRAATSNAGIPLQVQFVSRKEVIERHFESPGYQKQLDLPPEDNDDTSSTHRAPNAIAFKEAPIETGIVPEAYNAIVNPHRVEVFTQYFRKKWRPLLTPLLSELVRELRQRCYSKYRRNDGPEVAIEVTQEELAQALGVSRSTIARALTRDKKGNFKNPHLSYFIKEMTIMQDRRMNGRVKKTKTRFVVVVEEPLIPEDEAKLTE